MLEEMISQIENFFLELETLIKLQDKIQNQPEIKQKFKEGKKLIDELEEDNEEQHGLFRYKYHTKYASYLKMVGEVDNASKQEKLAKKFEKNVKKPEELDNYKTESVLFTEATLGNINQAFNPQEKYTREVQEAIENIQCILKDNIIEDIRQTFKQFNEIPKTFEDYHRIVICEAELHKLVDNLINEGLICLKEPQTLNNNKIKEQPEDQGNYKEKKVNSENEANFFSSLKSLKSLASEMAYLKRIAFIRHVLNSSHKKEILYNNILFTEEGINKRFRKLSLCFHPDKTNQPNTPNWVQDKHKNLSAELFRYILEFKESLLDKLDKISKNEGRLTFHEKKANELWKITIDYRNAAKDQWDKLKLLKKEEIKEFSSDELKRFSVTSGMLAYQEYRAACKIADKVKQLKKQVRLRGNIALCFYVSNQFLEAQLYALSAILLLLQNSQATQQDLIEAKKIFDKVKGGNSTEESPKLTTAIKLKDNTLALVKIVDQRISLLEKKNIQRLINDDIAKMGTELIFKADRSLVRYQASNEEILRAKNRAFKHKVAGGATIASGICVGGAVTVAASVHIYTTVFILGVTTVGGPVALLTGLATLGLGIWGGTSLWKKGTHLLEEPKTRENLNKIMINALNAYDNGEYQKFIEALSKEYEKNTRLLKLEDHDVINLKDMIDKLLSHGFRSDGIAYLLNLLGEVLSSGKIKVEGMTTRELKDLAMKVFRAVLNEKLIVEAKKMDDHIHELRKRSYKSTFRKFSDSVLLKEYSDIAQEHKNDAQKMPFQSRLEEMRNIARMNRAIFDILNTGPEEIARAIKTIKEIRDSINCNYQFVSTAKSRLEVLEDFLWIVDGEELPEELSEAPEELPKLSLITFPMEPIQDVHDLNKKLQQASSNQEKIHLYNSIAALYEQLAEKENQVNQLKYLSYWQAAQREYENTRELDPENLDAALGFAKCLVKLSKYTQVTELSITTPVLTSLSEYWCFRSIAYCKQTNYEMANECINEALKIDSKSKLADKQRTFLKKLSEENTIDYRINCYEKGKKTIKYEIDYLINYRNNSPVYNILSIDGGGIRGVLPALWLSEIEHRTHRPISHLFNMVAGTSTGGIIAAGLSAPSWESSLVNEAEIFHYSNFEPKFSALGLLNLYRHQAKSLFTMRSTKKNPFYEHFNKTLLDQALTELVIPAASKSTQSSLFTPLTEQYLFTRYDARNKNSKNDTFVNTLMATTAAPTFSSSYKIKGKGVFLDGGIHLNNPAMAAYHEAIRYKASKEKISVLSLGTGSYIPDPLNPDLYRDQLFWNECYKGAHPAQENDTDCKMYDMLGNRYQRWQVCFEEPIGFSDYESIPNLLEIGNQYIEELDASDENPINKLVESFDK